MKTPQTTEAPGIEAKASSARSLELVDAAKQPIGVAVELKDNPPAEEKPGADETPELARLRRLTKSISGWSKFVVDGQDYPFSQDRALALFQRFPHFADQIDGALKKASA